MRDANVARWRGLGAGTSAEGVGWGTGRQVLRPANPWLPPGMYALSLARFAGNLTGRARELVLRRAQASSGAPGGGLSGTLMHVCMRLPSMHALPAGPECNVMRSSLLQAPRTRRRSGRCSWS